MDSEQRQNVCVAVDLLRDHSTSHVKQAHVCICVCVGEQGLYALAGRTFAKVLSHALLILPAFLLSSSSLVSLFETSGTQRYISYFCCRAITYEPLYWQAAVLFLPSQ